MVKHKYRHIAQIEDYEEKFIWTRIIARNAPVTISPPSILSDKPIISKVNRYFHIVESDMQLINGAILSAELFTDDYGVNVNDFTIIHPNGYVNLFINAVMQAGGIYSVTPTSLILNADHATIYRGTPIIIESIGFFTEVM